MKAAFFGYVAGFVTLLGVFVGSAPAADKINVLIIDGQNNHKWAATTPEIKALMLKSGRFNVDVLTSPPKNAPKEAWNSFRPDFSKYQVIFSNYNGQDWPAEVRPTLEKYMADGGGLVIYHAANNAFGTWDEWNKMIALNWQKPTFGDRITVDDSGKMIRTPKGEGPGAGHGPQHEYEVVLRDTDHPITKGMPAKWLHSKDELYAGQRGPALNMHILATAFSKPEFKGTNANEPMVFTVNYGKGRVFVNLLGHDVPQTNAPDCATLLLRGTEWAATGQVTLPVPPEFNANPGPGASVVAK